MAICPFCKDHVPESEAWACPSCDALHHPECWNANQEMCSVFGCESRSGEIELLGCPYCEEAYPGGERVCKICGEPLMTAAGVADFLDQYEWQRLSTEELWNPMLAAGLLRNNGIVARVSKKAPISMYGFRPDISLWVPAEEVEAAVALLQSQSEKFQPCPRCGHTLFIDEEECSYCSEIGVPESRE